MAQPSKAKPRWRPVTVIVDAELHRKLKVTAANTKEPLYKLVERILWASVKAWEAEEKA